MLRRRTYHRLLQLAVFAWLSTSRANPPPNTVTSSSLTQTVLAVSAKSGKTGGGGGGGGHTDSDADDGVSSSGSGSSPNSNSGSSSGTGYPYYGAGYRGSFWPGGNTYSRPSSAGGSQNQNGGFDVESALHYRRIHGILASVVMVLLFPIGSILMRLVPGKFAVWVHGVFQAVAFCAYVAAAGVGIRVVQMVKTPRGSLVSSTGSCWCWGEMNAD